MEKKVLKMYEAPEVEIVDIEVEGFLCTSGNAVALCQALRIRKLNTLVVSLAKQMLQQQIL